MPRWRIQIEGVVQGVGFRPFLYRLAEENGLSGWVCNVEGAVTLEIQGDEQSLRKFCGKVKSDSPQAAILRSFNCETRSEKFGETSFEILPSESKAAMLRQISPDLAACSECIGEMLDAKDRRYRYPLLNCTKCGPRYSIIYSLPYDRAATTLADFKLCSACREEYEAVGDRRFHAQPTACSLCGPVYRLFGQGGLTAEGDEAVCEARRMLKDGRIVAVKGIGGYHLVCDAKNEEAVGELRRRKRRAAKPLALMAGSLAALQSLCRVTSQEEDELKSAARPIVLLEKLEASILPENIAPGQRRFGVMLPYAPIHWLLLADDDFFVMTSGNDGDEPIVYRDEECALKFAGLADAWLAHDRPILRPVEDSVLQFVAGRRCFIRRSRGYAPLPVLVSGGEKELFAAGGDLKNCFCLYRDGHAFMSSHIGDLAALEAQVHYQKQRSDYQSLLQCKPQATVCDLHPGYFSRRLMEKSDLPHFKVQHHHAHLASVAAEHGLEGPLLGIALDGTGYGSDGLLWGGEIMLLEGASFRHLAQLSPLMLPGGEAAIKAPWRTAAWLLRELYGDDAKNWPIKIEVPDGWQAFCRAVDEGFAAVASSGAARWFEAVAVLLGLGRENEYEGHLAGLLTEAVSGMGQVLDYELQDGEVRRIELRPLIKDIVSGLAEGRRPAELAADFHCTLFQALREMLILLRAATGVETVLLSGGVWQNRILLARALEDLPRDGFAIYCNQEVPANDGGLALGQVWVGGRLFKARRMGTG